MIYDTLNNIELYNNIPQQVRDFIKNLTTNIQPGRYELGDGIYANIDCYTTKDCKDAAFEAHNEYVDIQILLNGFENIYLYDRAKFGEKDVKVPYNSEKDIVFYNTDILNGMAFKLDGSNFILIFPHEAHAPQVAFNEPMEVKKVVVKIPVKLFG